MKAIKTVKCKFQVNIEQAAALLEIPQQFAGACNDTFRVFKKNFATTSNGLKFFVRQVIHTRRHCAQSQWKLQANGTKGENTS